MTLKEIRRIEVAETFQQYGNRGVRKKLSYLYYTGEITEQGATMLNLLGGPHTPAEMYRFRHEILAHLLSLGYKPRKEI